MARLETLISAEQIATRIAEMGPEIRAHFGDEPIVCVGVLKGSFLFMADLVRTLDGPVRCEFLGVSSYQGTQSTGTVRISHDLTANIEGKNVLLVEDIVDTGLTLDYLIRTLSQRKPKRLAVATLLDKPSRRRVQVPVDWVGFEIPDAFVVGYGLDLDQIYRNLPYIAVYDPS